MPVSVDGSVDEAVIRMGFYANQACQELLFKYNWENLSVPLDMNIVADSPGQTEKGFDMPADFSKFVDDTQWNRDTQLPAIGPVNPQDWQWLVVRDAMITTRFMWRMRGGQMWVKSPPETAQVMSLEYISKNWGVAADGVTPIEVMTADGDYHLYPWNLVVLLTRVKWLSNEGYDATVARSEFQAAFDYYTGANAGATALTLVPGIGYPYITAGRNLPDTGYGSD